ncbi:MAG: hypothetical protein N0C81_20730 [Candidatus Thiodiazotropha lotti]|nr:hypothetical protein [Candidatus Thiodiazotropha lotti]MCG8010056.1 hypothetical protein [Candidatus Thiodiazotropha lotti]MCW4185806.1 hypothetical protein [Candidatus Thiodiazotropha lotti]MCW4197650.1 hypothetical protein [Candidatus Thiodiazotropha lotti]
MWLTEIDPDKEYILQLCQNDEGRRYCVFRESEEVKSEFCVSESPPVPHEILKSKNINELCDFCNVVFGGHGEWYTEAESESMRNYDLGKAKVVQWSTEQAPCFAPK